MPDSKEPWWKRVVHKFYENREGAHYAFKKRGAPGYFDVTDPQITIDVRAMQRSEDLWPQAGIFRPERFEDNKNPPAFMPFGRGPHTCLSLSITEAGLVLSEIFNRVNLEMLHEPAGEQFAFTMRPVGALEMAVTPRTEAPP